MCLVLYGWCNITTVLPYAEKINSFVMNDSKNDIVAITSESAKTLATAVTAAGLVKTLQGEGPFTVFAPTDAAFASI